MEGLELKNLSITYGTKIICSNLNKFLPKKIYALIGNSGVGKSTLAKVIAGHKKATSGNVFIDSKEIMFPNRDVFIVHQDDDLFPWLNVKDQLLFIAKELNSPIDIESYLQKFKLKDSEKLFPNELSGGMKKRLALIRAEIVGSKVLILDETLSSLDQDLLKSILEEMIPVWKKRECVVIIITHQLEQIKEYIDEVWEISN